MCVCMMGGCIDGLHAVSGVPGSDIVADVPGAISMLLFAQRSGFTDRSTSADNPVHE